MAQEDRMTKNAPRITARVDEEIQSLLARAAALSGMSSINAFVVSSAVEKARKIIAEEEKWCLDEADSRLFVEALQRQPKKHRKLAEAFERYENDTLS